MRVGGNMGLDVSLVENWIALQHASPDSEDYDRLFAAAFDPVDEMTHERPDDVWDFILAVLRRDDSGEIVEVLSAGPLEVRSG